MATDTQKINWPGWEVVKLIGRGSFGAVYEIQRDVFGDIEKAALKVITIPQNESDIDEMYSDGYDDESITSTFQSHLKSIVAEYSLMRKMNGSPNIVNCDDIRYVQHDNGIGWDIFIKMELLTPLTKALPADIPEETVVKIAKDMCNALELCKAHGIVHRDIKPQNIFVSPYGDYKLGDFGIAKTVEKTMGGTKIGTYKYMAPEVYNNKPYGTAADIYSLGLVLYWLLNERRMPFLPLPPEKLNVGMEETARNRRLSGETLPPPAHGSEALKKIVLKACAYDTSDRYSSAAEMLQDLNMNSEEHRLEEAYAQAMQMMNAANSPSAFRAAAKKFEELSKCNNYGDSAARAQECYKKAEIARKDAILAEAHSKAEKGTLDSYRDAIKLYESIRGWKDADEQIRFCEKRIEELDQRKEKLLQTKSRQLPIAKIAKIVLIVIAAVVLVSCLVKILVPDNKTLVLNDGTSVLGDEVTVHETISAAKHSLAIKATNFAYGFQYAEGCTEDDAFCALIDANGHLWLCDINNETVCDTNVENVKDVAVVQNVDTKLYYLTTDGKVWKADVQWNSGWSYLGSERYGEWSNISRIYGFGYDHSRLVLLDANGSLFVDGNKVNIENVVDVQCVSDTFVVRTQDGTFYGFGHNKFGKFAIGYSEITNATISSANPAILSIDSNLASMRVVRVLGVQELMFAALSTNGTLTVYDDKGRVVTQADFSVDDIISADCSLYIVSHDGKLYGYGALSSGHPLTAYDSTRQNIRAISESETMNGVYAIAPFYYGYLAIDNSGKCFYLGRDEGDLVTKQLRYSDGSVFTYPMSNEATSANEGTLVLGDEVTVRETISTGYHYTVGLKADGTVVAIGEKGFGQCDVSDWTDIVAISARGRHTVGLKSDGTVVAVGWNDGNQCNVSDWTDIVAISAGTFHTVGLKANGTVVATGYNPDGQGDVSDWTDIVAISTGEKHTVGLKADGTVVAVGSNNYAQFDAISGWTDIVAISANWGHTVGLKSDGTVVAIGHNDGDGECDVSGWTDIMLPKNNHIPTIAG